MISEKTIICGTRREINKYLKDKFKFTPRTPEADGKNDKEINFDGITDDMPISKQIDNFESASGMIFWLKKHKMDNSKGYPEVLITMESQWVFIRDFKSKPIVFGATVAPTALT